jgi:hypothetical protein
MMNLLNYAPFWRGEGQTGRGGFALRGLSRKQTQGFVQRRRVNAFDVILTGDHGAVSVRDIGDEEED